FCRLPLYPRVPLLFPYTTLFRSCRKVPLCQAPSAPSLSFLSGAPLHNSAASPHLPGQTAWKGDESSEIQSRSYSGVCPTSYSLKDRKSTRLNSSHVSISYAVFCF